MFGKVSYSSCPKVRMIQKATTRAAHISSISNFSILDNSKFNNYENYRILPCILHTMRWQRCWPVLGGGEGGGRGGGEVGKVMSVHGQYFRGAEGCDRHALVNLKREAKKIRGKLTIENKRTKFFPGIYCINYTHNNLRNP